MRFAFSLFVLLTLGCGGAPSDMPDLGTVNGVVKVDGSPKAGIRVTFNPEQGRPATGVTNESGEYSLQYTASAAGAKIGKNLVRITSPEDSSDNGDGCGGSEGIFLDPIHPKYNTDAANNPEMTVEVKPGDNTFNFDVVTDTSARTPEGHSRGNTCE